MSLRPAAALLLGVLAFLPACRRPVDSPPGEHRELRIGIGIGKTARPAISVLVDLLYSEPLFRREWNGRNSPHLLSSWSWEDNGRAMRLELKSGLAFHDGVPLSAELLARHLRTLVATPDRPAAWGFGHVTSVDVVTDRIVRVNLDTPDVFLLSALSDIKVTSPGNANTATGPFILKSREGNVQLTRFDGYHGGEPGFGSVTVRTFDTQRSAWAALMRGEVDVVQEVSRDSVEFMQDANGVRTYSALQPFYVSLVFNHRQPLLKDVALRRAISEGIDREEIVRVGMRDRGLPAASPIWPFHWAFEDPDAERTTYAPERARRQIETMHLPPRSVSHDQPPSRVRLRCLVYSEDAQYERIALLAQRQLFKIGVDLDLELKPLDQISARIVSGQFDTYILPANASRTLERLYRLWHSDGPEGKSQLNSGYAGADTVLEALRASVDEQDFRRNVKALLKTFDDDVPAAFIAWLEVTRAVSTSIEIPNANDRDPFSSLWQWRPPEHARYSR